MKQCADDVVRAYPLFQGESGGAIPTSALQLHLCSVSERAACYLNGLWHSRLPKLHWSNIVRNRYWAAYAALYDFQWWAVLIWTSPVSASLDPATILELRRFAIRPGAPKNTGSRLLSVCTRLVAKEFPAIRLLVSYQDIEVHNGPLYKSAGWTCAGLTDKRGSRRKGGVHNGRDVAPGRKLRWEKVL